MSVKDTRLSQILPVIRCSDCGHEVQFRMLGEHICSSAPPLPIAPVMPLARKSISGVSSGGYKPGHRPPPIPITAPLAISKHNNYPREPPLTPGRPSISSQRPSLPFLEKYAKKNKSTSSITPPTPTSATHPEYGYGQRSNDGYGITLSSAPLLLSPTTPTTPGPYGQPGHGNSHYVREQRDYFPRTPTDDCFSSLTNQPQQPYGRHTPIPRTPEMPGSKTPVLESTKNFSTPITLPSRTSLHPQPALPQKSNARSPSIASAHGLGLLVDVQGKMKPLPLLPLGDYDRVNSPSMDYTSPVSPPPPSVSSKFSRSGSSGSVASSIVAEPRPSVSYNRERSNTAQSERSERSSRSVRSERTRVDLEPQRSGSGRSLMGREREQESRGQLAPLSRSERPRGRDATSASKIPSPPVSPAELRSEPIMSSRPQYRPPTPPEASSPTPTRGRRPSVAPSRKPSTDQFDALMEDLMQEIKILPTGTSSVRNSTRSVSSSASRSRSRPNFPEFGQRDRAFTASSTSTPPPTPGLPNITGGTESLRGCRSSTREIRPTASERAHERERSRTLDDKPSDRERGRERERERDKERLNDREARERVREREREREQTDDRQRDRDRSHRTTEREPRVDRARDRDRDRASTRSSIRSRSLNARTGIAHCQVCKHDIQPHEALDAVKMAHGDYHRECFKCGRCRRPIESARQAHEHEGRLLCERDFTRVKEKEAQKAAAAPSSTTPSASSPPSSRRPTCAGCEGFIQNPDPVVYALGKSWHVHHLSCDHCHKPIQASVGHVEKNGRVYCPTDYGALFLPKCRGCGHVVEKEAVCAQDGKLEGKWHAACFGCQLCKKPFPDQSFYVFENAPYCRRHYHKMNNSLCKGCDKPIEGPCAQTMEGWRFHPNCFSCVECRAPLTDVYYNYENKAYCERDIMIIQRTRHNVRAERRRTFVGRI